MIAKGKRPSSMFSESNTIKKRLLLVKKLHASRNFTLKLHSLFTLYPEILASSPNLSREGFFHWVKLSASSVSGGGKGEDEDAFARSKGGVELLSKRFRLCYVPKYDML